MLIDLQLHASRWLAAFLRCCNGLTFLAWSITSGAQVPLPSDASITPPGSDVRPEVSAFSGSWSGSWQGILDSVLIVQYIDNERALVIYGWADAPQWKITKNYVIKLAQVVSGEGSVLRFSGGAVEFTATMGSDLSTVRMTRRAPFQNALIETFSRRAPAPIDVAPPTARPPRAIDISKDMVLGKTWIYPHPRNEAQFGNVELRFTDKGVAAKNKLASTTGIYNVTEGGICLYLDIWGRNCFFLVEDQEGTRLFHRNGGATTKVSIH
jgi:hypothetical protein